MKDWTPDDTARAVALHAKGYTYDNIAQIMGRSKWSVVSRLKRIRRVTQAVECRAPGPRPGSPPTRIQDEDDEPFDCTAACALHLHDLVNTYGAPR